MSRLYDRMMRGPLPEKDWSTESLLPHATVVEVSNVAAYYAENILKDGKSRMSLTENATGWISPWEHSFFEFRPPRGLYGDDPAPYHAVGWHVVTIDRENMLKAMPFTDDERDALFDHHAIQRGYRRSVDSLRWLCIACLYMEQPKGRVFGPVLELTYALDYDIEMVNHDDLAPGAEPALNFTLRRELVEPGEDPMDFVTGIAAELQVVTMAVAFTHCKNVAVDENPPPYKLNRSHRRKHGRDLITYRTLAIEPMREALRRESGGQPISAERALHICRGHFATYSEDKPLFGKYVGTFWKPQHTRGSKVYGEVAKDYAVNAPRGVQ